MKVTRNCIEYHGIADYIPCDVLAFNDCIVENTNILKDKPKINYFTKCRASLNVGNIEVLNLDDKYKVSVEGSLYARIEYVSSEYDNLICIEKKQIDFNIDIDVLDRIDENTEVIVNLFIEDIYLKKISQEEYFLSFSILGVVEE